MDFILLKHGKSNQKSSIPKGIHSLISDITREILRHQPDNLYEFIANYLESLLIVRENTKIANQVIGRLFETNMAISDIASQTGIHSEQAKFSINNIFDNFDQHVKSGCSSSWEDEKFIAKLIAEFNVDAEKADKMKNIIDSAYRSYAYNWLSCQTSVSSRTSSDLPDWQDSVKTTLDFYKIAEPNQAEMDRAAVIIQKIYRGYASRKSMSKNKLSNLDACAIKIQSAFRGYSVRKSMGSFVLEKKQLSRIDFNSSPASINDNSDKIVGGFGGDLITHILENIK